MTPEKARKELHALLKKDELSKEELASIKQLTITAYSDIPPIQHWVLSSAGPSNNGWTDEKWKKFQGQLPKMVSDIDVPIYRGTKFPWIQGGHKKFKNLTEIKDAIKKFDENFSNKRAINVKRIMPFTKDRKIADKFASEAKGYKTDEGYTFDNGFIHVIKPAAGIQAVDVVKELRKVHKAVFADHNELQVSRREKEVLIIPGTTIRPVSKQGRVYTWEIDVK